MASGDISNPENVKVLLTLGNDVRQIFRAADPVRLLCPSVVFSPLFIRSSGDFFYYWHSATFILIYFITWPTPISNFYHAQFTRIMHKTFQFV